MPAPRTGILLVEDDADYAYLLRRMLSTGTASRFDLHHASTLAQGLARLAGGDIDVFTRSRARHGNAL